MSSTCTHVGRPAGIQLRRVGSGAFGTGGSKAGSQAAPPRASPVKGKSAQRKTVSKTPLASRSPAMSPKPPLKSRTPATNPLSVPPSLSGAPLAVEKSSGSKKDGRKRKTEDGSSCDLCLRESKDQRGNTHLNKFYAGDQLDRDRLVIGKLVSVKLVHDKLVSDNVVSVSDKVVDDKAVDVKLASDEIVGDDCVGYKFVSDGQPCRSTC